MIKPLLAGAWTMLLFSGSLYFFNGAGMTPEEALALKEKYQGKLEIVKLEPMSVTIIRNNRLQGYVILNISFTIRSIEKAKLAVPAELILRDAVNSSVFGNKEIDINHLELFDLEKFKNQIMSEISEKFGEEVLDDILVERIDFISGDSIRDKKLRGG